MGFPRFDYMRWAKHEGRRATLLLCESELPCPTPSQIDLASYVLEFTQLPFDEPGEFGRFLADREGIPPDRVLPCAGASHGLYVVAGALLEAGDRVLVETPAYPPLELVPRCFGAQVIPLPRPLETGHKIDLGLLESLLAPRARMIVLTNLHNPTGARLDIEEMAEIATLAARFGATVVVDEVYREFLEDLPSAVRAGPNVVAISSATKAFGLGGLRAGWIFGPREILARVVAFNDLIVVNPPAPSIRLAAAALRDTRFVTHCRTEARLRRLDRLVGLVESLPALEWARPHGGLVGFPRLRDTADATPLVGFLARKFDVQVVPGKFFGAPAHFRIGCGGPLEEFDRALTRFTEGLTSWSLDPTLDPR